MRGHLFVPSCKYHGTFTCQPSLVAKVNFSQHPNRNNSSLGIFQVFTVSLGYGQTFELAFCPKRQYFIRKKKNAPLWSNWNLVPPHTHKEYGTVYLKEFGYVSRFMLLSSGLWHRITWQNLPWRCMQYVPPKRWHTVSSRKTAVRLFKAVKSSDFVSQWIWNCFLESHWLRMLGS